MCSMWGSSCRVGEWGEENDKGLFKISKPKHSHTGLWHINYWRTRDDITETYKHTHGKYTVVAEYIKMDTDSRAHKYKLKKQQATKTIMQQYFNNRIINTWNMLPADVIDAPSLNSSKARINIHWCQYKYSLPSVHEACNATSK